MSTHAPAADLTADITEEITAETTGDGSGSAPGGASGSRVTGRRGGWWRRNGSFVGLAAALVLVAALGAIAATRGGDRAYDPDSYAPRGTRALATILGDQGVEVRRIERLDELRDAAGPGTTVLLAPTTLSLPSSRLSELAASGADLVLLDPIPDTVSALAPELQVTDRLGTSGAVAVDCPDPDARAAGDVDAGGQTYQADDEAPGGRDVTVCYLQGDGSDRGAAYAVVAGTVGGTTGTTGTTVLIGRPELLTNDELARRGHAALALRATGRQPVLLWYLPDALDPALLDDPQAPQPDWVDLLPRWVGWVALQLAVVTAVAVVWRSRRLGRLVPERLPAVVRSVETAEGRARLYRRARARERAATALRVQTARDLARRLGAPRGSGLDVVAALAAAATGLPPMQVAYLLTGPPPLTDPDLVSLADQLDALVARVGASAVPRPAAPPHPRSSVPTARETPT